MKTVVWLLQVLGARAPLQLWHHSWGGTGGALLWGGACAARQAAGLHRRRLPVVG